MNTDRSEKASALFTAGCTCSQSVFVAYSDLCGLDEKTAMRLSCGLGAGVGRLREVCGAVTGMALLAGLKHGNETPADADAKKKTYEVVQLMAGAFKAKHGTLICRELLGLDAAEGDPAPAARTEAYYSTRPCARLVADAAKIAAQHLF